MSQFGGMTEEVGSPQIARQQGWMPRVDVLEAQTHVLVRVELAGVPTNHVFLSYNPQKNALVVRGERPGEPEANRYEAHILEIETGQFSRDVPLPEVNLDLRSVKSEMKNGILSIYIPKESAGDQVVIVERITVTKF